MRVIGLICARAGSKGLPAKNLRLLAGRPLVAWSIAHARAVARIERTIVSTDSEEIARVAREYGAEVPFMRPASLAQDDSPEWLVWRHLLDFLKSEGTQPDALIIVPPTAPLRIPADLERCLDEFSKGNADAVITVTDAHRNPYFNMVEMNADGSVQLVIAPEKQLARRQDAPAVFDMTTVAYVVRPSFVELREGILDGCVRCVHVPPERALDIDTPLDFRIADCLVAGRAQ